MARLAEHFLRDVVYGNPGPKAGAKAHLEAIRLFSMGRSKGSWRCVRGLYGAFEVAFGLGINLDHTIEQLLQTLFSYIWESVCSEGEVHCTRALQQFVPCAQLSSKQRCCFMYRVGRFYRFMEQSFGSTKPWSDYPCASAMYEEVRSRASDAAVSWLLVAKQLGVQRDVAILVAKKVYASRYNDTERWANGLELGKFTPERR